jgi:hypothetical protein
MNELSKMDTLISKLTTMLFASAAPALEVTCQWEYIETLEGWYKHAKICCPVSPKDANGDFTTKYPITIY